MIAPALAPLAPACPNAPKSEETHTEWALPHSAPLAPAENRNGAAMGALWVMAARWRLPGAVIAPEPSAGGCDDPEREAMAAHYAAPASARPYLPGDPCALRDGLLRGARPDLAAALNVEIPQFMEGKNNG